MLSTLARFYVDGGAFMHGVLLVGTLATAAVLLQFRFLRRRPNLLPLTIGLLFTTMSVGLLGTVAGLSQAMQAIAFAPPDLRQTLTAQALGIAVYPLTFGLLFLIVLAPPASLAVAARASMRSG